ncbi:MAG TPA: hypothetical protein PKB14_04330 [Rubrivivax sp.]|nr:hypothetical protein [Rubrivivax sp.]
MNTEPTAQPLLCRLRRANEVARAAMATGRHPFGALLALTGNHAENPTLNLPCREVFARAQKAVRVWGPVPEAGQEIAELHRGFRRAR